MFGKDLSTLLQYPAKKTDTEYTIPNGVTDIGKSAFRDCWRLNSVTIPNSVIHIEDYAFSLCRNLKQVTVGSGVEHIGGNAFHGSGSVSDIYYVGTQGRWNTVAREIIEMDDENQEFQYKRVTVHFLNPDKAISAPAEAATGLNITPVGDALPSGAGVSVESADAQAASYVAKELGSVRYAAYEINLHDAQGNTIQPDSGLLLMDIDVPEGFVGSDCAVFRAEKDDSLTDMHAKYVNGKLQFPSEHCSLYIITDKQPVHSHSPAAAVYENIVAAACTEAGSHDEVVYCSECGNELSRVNVKDNATGHSFSLGKCQICGEPDPDYNPGGGVTKVSFFQRIIDFIKSLFSWLPFC